MNEIWQHLELIDTFYLKIIDIIFRKIIKSNAEWVEGDFGGLHDVLKYLSAEIQHSFTRRITKSTTKARKISYLTEKPVRHSYAHSFPTK